VVLQFSKHAAFDEALLVPVVDVPVDGVAGTMQLVWHIDDWELQVIMQLVTVELCARRIVPCARVSFARFSCARFSCANAAADALVMRAAKRIVSERMMVVLLPSSAMIAHCANCRNTRGAHERRN
jgi:hypothetical protein